MTAETLPGTNTVKTGWFWLAILLLAAATALSVLVIAATGLSDAHRAAAALAAMLDVAALATVAHVTLLWYQSRIAGATGAETSAQTTLALRRRGLKGAVMGEDGRASTSKSQVVVWTGAVIWALTDLLLLARGHHGGTLFAAADGNNWRPEYLALLGLPAAAAATAKAAVVSSNGGLGPQRTGAAAGLPGARVYVRDPVPDNKDMRSVANGLAELITTDDGSVSWADLQYIVFTLITLAYFVVQLLTQPGSGLPPVPAALLTLTGVSAGAYTANKLVDTRGSAQPSATAPVPS